ncbi:GyrI-like domain-containing protein [Deferrisoma camini]|uniref:GyrI-like domain-containing protein n=1 Tax=Deferrisoma camini TaxID=1035120 RepID=UPI0004B306A9|nr:GyrI-like domain-containing protein [Deferrisoma camini]
MKKINFKKELKPLYSASSKKVAIVDVPKMNFLMIDGEGDPNTSREFQEAVEALFSLSYTLKFMIKKSELSIDYGVMPLEGLWWVDDMTQFSIENKEDWKWTLMIMQPKFVKEKLVIEAKEQPKKKKNLPALSKVHFKEFSEGKVAQIMHIGPFSEEGPTIEKLHDFIKDNGYKLYGKHHEIYLSDIRRATPENWKTIIRQPIR